MQIDTTLISLYEVAVFVKNRIAECRVRSLFDYNPDDVTRFKAGLNLVPFFTTLLESVFDDTDFNAKGADAFDVAANELVKVGVKPEDARFITSNAYGLIVDEIATILPDLEFCGSEEAMQFGIFGDYDVNITITNY